MPAGGDLPVHSYPFLRLYHPLQAFLHPSAGPTLLLPPPPPIPCHGCPHACSTPACQPCAAHKGTLLYLVCDACWCLQDKGAIRTAGSVPKNRSNIHCLARLTLNCPPGVPISSPHMGLVLNTVCFVLCVPLLHTPGIVSS